jgi:hypothetical protein
VGVLVKEGGGRVTVLDVTQENKDETCVKPLHQRQGWPHPMPHVSHGPPPVGPIRTPRRPRPPRGLRGTPRPVEIPALGDPNSK